jgi:ABC-type branched-subunit amino acid transport system substrate-binding protein
MRPFSKFTKPYYEHYQKLVEYNGGARDVRTVKPEEVDEVRIGFLGPVENHPDQALGQLMLQGAQLAVEEANTQGGYGGKPFRLMIHNDQATWGAASNEIVKMTYDEKVWAMLGSISGDSTHIGLRVSLKAEVPIVNSAATDPTIPETIIPWYLSTIQDDRVQCYTLARRIYSDLKLSRVALLRINDRYGRFGVGKFKDASRRLGHPVVIEQKYFAGDTDFRRQLGIIRDADADAIVIWGDSAAAGGIVKQMRELGMKQRVFGSFRVLGDNLLPVAGEAADGMEAVYPFDPMRDDPLWASFIARFEKRFGRKPEAFASLAYDTMNILLQQICRAGLNRGKIRDALTGVERYKGVTGEMTFDPNCKNVVPMYLATVRGGKIDYRRYPMDAPYARVGEAPVSYNGPATVAVAADSPVRIAVFGSGAADLPARDGVVVRGVSSDTPWGKASSELVRLIYDEHAAGVVATDRNSSHVAEQIAVKALVPVIALSSDRTLTSVNIPWIFRMPAGSTVEDAVARMADAARKGAGDRNRVREALATSGYFGITGEPIATLQ